MELFGDCFLKPVLPKQKYEGDQSYSTLLSVISGSVIEWNLYTDIYSCIDTPLSTYILSWQCVFEPGQIYRIICFKTIATKVEKYLKKIVLAHKATSL